MFCPQGKTHRTIKTYSGRNTRAGDDWECGGVGSVGGERTKRPKGQKGQKGRKGLKGETEWGCGGVGSVGVWEKGSVGGGSVTRRRGERGGETGVGSVGVWECGSVGVWGVWGKGDDGENPTRSSFSSPVLVNRSPFFCGLDGLDDKWRWLGRPRCRARRRCRWVRPGRIRHLGGGRRGRGFRRPRTASF